MKTLSLMAAAIVLLGAAPATDSMKVRMGDKVNPAFTHVSYELFHGKTGNDAALLQAVQRLELTTRELAKAPGAEVSVHEADPQFRAYAVQLHTHAHALMTAVTEHADRAELEHWFSHVRASCESCHTQFKDDTK